MTSPVRGRFITLEGIDGAGKSTHAAWIAETIAARGHRVVATREPGGTPLGERLRDLILHEPMGADTETLLMFAARREHVASVIQPALARGNWVLCDRFTDATYAYQGGGKGVATARLADLERWVHGDCQPDLTLLFDLPIEVARARLARAHESGRAMDKFERERDAFFERVQAAYRARAEADPRRIRVIAATHAPAEVRAAITEALAAL